MEKNYHEKLEKLIDAELKNLPALPAPVSLLPLVLQAIAAEAGKPWWMKPLLAWPLLARLAFCAFLLFLLGAAVSGANWLIDFIWSHGFTLEFIQQVKSLSPFWDAAVVLGNVLARILGALSKPWICGLIASGAFVYLSCLGLGFTFYRVACPRRF